MHHHPYTVLIRSSSNLQPTYNVESGFGKYKSNIVYLVVGTWWLLATMPPCCCCCCCSGHSINHHPLKARMSQNRERKYISRGITFSFLPAYWEQPFLDKRPERSTTHQPIRRSSWLEPTCDIMGIQSNVFNLPG